jgi:hypothetical protein
MGAVPNASADESVQNNVEPEELMSLETGES